MRTPILIIILLISFSTNSLFANEWSFFLQNDPPHSREDSLVISNYYKQSLSIMQYDIDSSKIYIDKLYEFADSKQNIYGLTKSYITKTYYEVSKGNFSDAIEYADKAVEYSLKQDDLILKSDAYNVKSFYYHSILDAGEALKHSIIALDYSKHANDVESRVRIIGNIIYTLLLEDNISEAEDYLNEYHSIIKTIDDPISLINYHRRLGLLNSKKGNYSLAEKELKTALAIAEKEVDLYEKAHSYKELGDVYSGNQQVKIAEESYRKAIQLFNQQGDFDDEIKTYLPILKLYNSVYDSDNVIETANEANSLIEKYGNEGQKMQFFEELSIAYAKNGQFKEAFEYNKISREWADSVFALSKSMKVLELDAQYRLENKNLSLKLLEEEYVKDKILIRQKSQTNIIFLLTSLVIGIVAFVFWQRSRNRKKFNRELKNNVKDRTKELEETNQKLMRSNQELERFAYITSHDMREPLVSIESFSTLIEESINENDLDTASSYLQYVNGGVTQLKQLVEGILNYSRLTSNQLTPNEVDLNIVVDRVKDTLQSSFSESNAQFKFNQQLPTVKGDEFHFYQLFVNLIKNGIKYNEDENPTVELKFEETNEEYFFDFIDNGIGIAPKHHQLIYSMFKRLHNRSKYTGTGLGLAIVKKIVDSLGGKIELRSSLGKGSSFKIQIPKI